MKKITKRLIAGMASAVMLTGAFAAVVSAARSDTDEKPSLTSLPTPISSDPKNTDYRIFKRAKPVVKAMTNDDDRYYYYYSYSYRVLSWEPISNALYYSVYVKYPGDKEFKHLDDTLETEFPIKDENAQYKVRPMTFSYDDKKISGAFSDPVSVRKTKKMRPVYDDNDYLEGDAVYEEEEAADAEPPMMATNSVSYASSAARTKNAGAVSGAPAPYGIPIYGNTEEYQHYDESGFKSAAQSPLSTFSADVDTASYANVRRMIKGDYSIPEDAVRIEEFINYLDYGYPAPDADNTLSVSTTLSDCPWNSKAKLLRVGVQAKELEKEPASNLVFLIDVSGSMYSQDKLPLVVESINELTRNLSSKDTISMVVYSGEERIVLAGAKGNQTNTVKTLTSMLEADGSTNGEQGINMAYDIAKKYFKKGANNRVIMATDGDLNVGISDKDELEKFIAGKAESGIYLTILGFGTENIKDNKMEALAKEGNGNYYYIDCFEEAQKVLSEEK
ncbi:MAG: von Willebrand factor type A domain-containing protein, partial [Oscillospiraceae bacterium]|nr:von Willebrand factor type A domain-containing protein [Oscillospiraceae bacterium]